MPTLRVDINANGVEIGSRKAVRALEDIQKEAKQTARSVNAAEESIDKTGKRLASFDGSRISSSFESITKRVMSLQTAFLGLGVAAAAFDIAKVGAEFELTMRTVQGVMRATESEFQSLTEAARRMGEQTEWSASQSGQALQFLGMAGFNAEQAIAALPGTLNLATAGQIELGRAADIASNALTAMGLEVDELSRVNDVFVGTITRTNTNMESMAESFKYAAPAAKAYGYSIEELSAMIGTLGNAGIQGSMAGTQLSAAFSDVSKVFDKYGVSAKNADGSTKNLIDAIRLMVNQGATAGDYMQIFGERSGRAALVLKDAIPAFEGLRDQLRGAEGEANTLAEAMRNTTSGAFKELMSTIESIKLDIFESQVGGLNETIKALTEYLRDNKEQIVGFANSLATAAGNMGPIVEGVGNLIARMVDGWNELPEPIKSAGLLAFLFGSLGVKLGLVAMADMSNRLTEITNNFDAFKAKVNENEAKGNVLSNWFYGENKDMSEVNDNMLETLETIKRIGDEIEALENENKSGGLTTEQLYLLEGWRDSLQAEREEYVKLSTELKEYYTHIDALSPPVKKAERAFIDLDKAMSGTDWKVVPNTAQLEKNFIALDRDMAGTDWESVSKGTEKAGKGVDTLSEKMLKLRLTILAADGVMIGKDVPKDGFMGMQKAAEDADKMLKAMNGLNQFDWNRVQEGLKMPKDSWLIKDEDAKAVKERTDALLDEIEAGVEQNAEAVQKIYDNMLQNVQRHFADAIYNMLSGELSSWEDFFDSILDMFLKMVAEMAAVDIMNMLFGQSKSGGLMEFFGNLFGGSDSGVSNIADGIPWGKVFNSAGFVAAAGYGLSKLFGADDKTSSAVSTAFGGANTAVTAYNFLSSGGLDMIMEGAIKEAVSLWFDTDGIIGTVTNMLQGFFAPAYGGIAGAALTGAGTMGTAVFGSTSALNAAGLGVGYVPGSLAAGGAAAGAGGGAAAGGSITGSTFSAAAGGWAAVAAFVAMFAEALIAGFGGDEDKWYYRRAKDMGWGESVKPDNIFSDGYWEQPHMYEWYAEVEKEIRKNEKILIDWGNTVTKSFGKTFETWAKSQTYDVEGYEINSNLVDWDYGVQHVGASIMRALAPGILGQLENLENDPDFKELGGGNERGEKLKGAIIKQINSFTQDNIIDPMQETAEKILKAGTYTLGRDEDHVFVQDAARQEYEYLMGRAQHLATGGALNAKDFEYAARSQRHPEGFSYESYSELGDLMNFVALATSAIDEITTIDFKSQQGKMDAYLDKIVDAKTFDDTTEALGQYLVMADLATLGILDQIDQVVESPIWADFKAFNPAAQLAQLHMKGPQDMTAVDFEAYIAEIRTRLPQILGLQSLVETWNDEMQGLADNNPLKVYFEKIFAAKDWDQLEEAGNQFLAINRAIEPTPDLFEKLTEGALAALNEMEFDDFIEAAGQMATAYKAINDEIDAVLNPMTSYAQAQSNINTNFGNYTKTLKDMGFVQEEIDQIEAKRLLTLAKLHDQYIADIAAWQKGFAGQTDRDIGQGILGKYGLDENLIDDNGWLKDLFESIASMSPEELLAASEALGIEWQELAGDAEALRQATENMAAAARAASHAFIEAQGELAGSASWEVLLKKFNTSFGAAGTDTEGNPTKEFWDINRIIAWVESFAGLSEPEYYEKMAKMGFDKSGAIEFMNAMMAIYRSYQSEQKPPSSGGGYSPTPATPYVPTSTFTDDFYRSLYQRQGMSELDIYGKQIERQLGIEGLVIDEAAMRETNEWFKSLSDPADFEKAAEKLGISKEELLKIIDKFGALTDQIDAANKAFAESFHSLKDKAAGLSDDEVTRNALKREYGYDIDDDFIKRSTDWFRSITDPADIEEAATKMKISKEALLAFIEALLGLEKAAEAAAEAETKRQNDFLTDLYSYWGERNGVDPRELKKEALGREYGYDIDDDFIKKAMDWFDKLTDPADFEEAAGKMKISKEALLDFIKALGGLEKQAKVTTDQIEEWQAGLRGESDQYRLDKINRKYGTDIGFNIDELEAIIDGFGDMDAEELRKYIEANTDIEWEDIAGDVDWLNEILKQLKDAAAEAAAALEESKDSFYRLQMQVAGMTGSQIDIAMIGKSLGIDITSAFMADSLEWFENASYAEFAAVASTMGLTTDALMSIIASFQSATEEANSSVVDYGDSASSAADAARDLAAEFQRLADAWGQLAEDIRSTIEANTFGAENPADVFERLGLIKAQIDAGYDPQDPESVRAYYDLLNQYLQLAGEAYQRPSDDYQSVYEWVMAELANLESLSTENEASMLALAQQQNELLAQIEANTRGGGANAGGGGSGGSGGSGGPSDFFDIIGGIGGGGTTPVDENGDGYPDGQAFLDQWKDAEFWTWWTESDLWAEKYRKGVHDFIVDNNIQPEAVWMKLVSGASQLYPDMGIDTTQEPWNYPYFKNLYGFRDGGIAFGPNSGHWELLHGNELIIPLDKLPVTAGITSTPYSDRAGNDAPVINITINVSGGGNDAETAKNVKQAVIAALQSNTGRRAVQQIAGRR